MRVLQADPGVDGWWMLVEADDGASHLLSFPDEKGRKASRPSDARQLAALADMVAAPDPLPDPPFAVPSDPIAAIESAVMLIDRGELSVADEARLGAALAALGEGA